MNFLGFENLTGEAADGLRILVIIGALLLLLVVFLLFDAIENARIRSWLKQNSDLEIPMSPWRTLIPWHREGTKWYIRRCSDTSIRYGVKNAESAAETDKLYSKINKSIKVRGYRYRGR